MKAKTILLTSLLVVSLILSGCGSKEKPTETTVNLPVVSGKIENTTVPPAATEVSGPAVAYPVAQATGSAALEVAVAYPVGDDSSPTYNADMRAYIEQILGGTIAIEDLFGKGDDELRTILQKAAEGRIILSETSLEKAVDWLKKQ